MVAGESDNLWQQQQQEHRDSPCPAAPRLACGALRHCCHRVRHHHRRCCCNSRRGAPQPRREVSSSSGSSRSLRRRCGCGMGEYIFLLIPRTPLSPGAAFLFSLLEEASPSFRCAVDVGGTLAKLVFIEELGSQSAAAAAEAAAAEAAAAAASGFSRRDPQLAARAYASNCDAALDLASPLLTIRGQSVFITCRVYHLDCRSSPSQWLHPCIWMHLRCRRYYPLPHLHQQAPANYG